MKLGFKKHHIADFSLGEMLQIRRNELGFSLEKAAYTTKLKKSYLEALEQGRYGDLPEGVYGKNFLNQYCDYLGLSYKKMLSIYVYERGIFDGEQNKREVFSHQRAKRRYFFLLPKLWRSIILGLVILAGFTYIGLRVKKIIALPRLDIYFPPASYITDAHEIEVAGRIEDGARLFINDTEIVNIELGEFKEVISLKQGVNIITVKAEKKYGQDTEIIRQILLK